MSCAARTEQLLGEMIPCVGTLAHLSAAGQAFVDFPGNPAGPVAARLIHQSTLDVDECAREDIPVLLVFDGNQLSRPIIVGVVRDSVPRPGNGPGRTAPKTSGREVKIDGESVILEAKHEVVLRCGEGSITLTRDGRIVTKGTRLVSRASETNRIKGGTVSIN